MIGDLIKKEWRLVAFILGIILILGLTWYFRGVLLPFILGFIFAYILLPVIHWLEKNPRVMGKRPRVNKLLRTITIFTVYVLSLVIVGSIVFYLIYVISHSLSSLSGDASQIIPNGLDTIKGWVKSLPFLSSPEIQSHIDDYFQNVSAQLPALLTTFLSNGWQLISTSLNTIAGFIIMPIFTFYLLYDWENIRDKFYGGQSPWMRKHTEGVFNILRNVIIRYIRGQLLLGLVVGICVWIMLVSFRIPFALPLAIFSAVTELVPMIGPWIGGGLGVLVTLAIDPHKAIWVGIGYIVIQLLENQLLVPKIQGAQMGLHPALVILLSILGAYFAGILGFVIVLPVTMLVIRLYRYFKDSFNESLMAGNTPSDESWTWQQ